MSKYQNALIQIKETLRERPRGLTIQELSQEININRNSLAKYLDVMLISGQLEMRPVGKAKMYYHSDRVPMSAMLNISSEYIVVVNKALEIMQVNDAFLDFFHVKREVVLGKKYMDIPKNLLNTQEIGSLLSEEQNNKYITKEISVKIKNARYYFKVKMIPTTFEDGSHGRTLLLENITQRKLIEETLKESELRFRELTELLPTGVFETDLEGSITYMNPTGLELFGYTHEDLNKGLKSFQMVIPEEREKLLKNKQKIVQEQKVMSVEYTALKKDGTTFDAYVDSAPIIRNGEVVGSRGSIQNITERKNTEEEIENLAKFPSENPNPIMRIGKSGVLLYANAVSKSWLDEWKSGIGKPVPEMWFQFVNQVYRSSLSESVEFKHNNRVYTFLFVPVIESNYVNIYGRDITERKKLDDERDRLFNAIEITKEAVSIKSSDLIFIYTNDAMDKLFGYEKRELIGKHVSILNVDATSNITMSKIVDNIEKDGGWEGEVHNKRKDGSEFMTYATITTIKDGEGKIINFISTQHNQT